MITKPKEIEYSKSLAKVSLQVAAFGSSYHAAWWNCSFLSPAGIETLAFNFPRTAVSAAVTATSKAAALKHDQAAGSVGMFHLFRLPPGLNKKVHRQLVTDGSNLAEDMTTKELCLEALRSLAEGATPTRQCPGAQNLGEFSPDDHKLVALLAASYLAAFTEGYETFPYFTFL